MPARPSPLWSSPAFRALWGSDTISLLGLHTTLLALPLTAIGLGATPVQVGLLTTAQTAPALLFGLFAGALVDRYRRRSLLLAANLARAALLASLPLAAALGRLHLAQLYLIAFLSGVAALVFVVAYQGHCQVKPFGRRRRSESGERSAHRRPDPACTRDVSEVRQRLVGTIALW